MLRRSVPVMLMLCLAVSASLLRAQTTTTGELGGTVTDPTGAVVTNASIVLTNVATGAKQSTQTNSTGAYHFSLVQPGTYKVAANASGFQGVDKTVDVGLGASRSVVTLPASAISYAPYGDSVFVITDLKDPKGKAYRGVRQQFVKLEGSRGDQVAVISGVNPGDEVVTSGVFKLRNGAAVEVNNKVQPGNNPAPKPEDS